MPPVLELGGEFSTSIEARLKEQVLTHHSISSSCTFQMRVIPVSSKFALTLCHTCLHDQGGTPMKHGTSQPIASLAAVRRGPRARALLSTRIRSDGEARDCARSTPARPRRACSIAGSRRAAMLTPPHPLVLTEFSISFASRRSRHAHSSARVHLAHQ